MISRTAGFVMETNPEHSMFQFVILRCALAMCCFFCGEVQGQGIDGFREQFLSDAPQAWVKVHDRAQHLQGSFSFKSVLPSGEVIAHQNSAIKQRQGCTLYLEQNLLPQENQNELSLLALNPQYGFELRKGDQTKEWTVPQVVLNSVKPRPFDALFQKVEIWSNAPITFFTVSGLFPSEKKGAWPTMIKEPGFSLKTVIAQPKKGKKWLKVEFEYLPNGKSARVPSRVTGWAVLDPERHWSMQEYEIQLEWAHQVGVKVVYAASYEYEKSEKRFPLLKRIQINYSNPQKSYQSHYSYEFDLKEAEVSLDEFTLSGYGFPEPVGITWEKPKRWLLWIAVASALSLAAGVLCWKLRRRYQTVLPDAASKVKEGGS